MKKISIIMPCYNAENVIDKSIETLINQTMGLESMELIFVDDASTDRTMDKLCKWEEKYQESVMVIHCDENGRQGRARNIGLSYASGEYIGFMDNDDFIQPDMYEKMYQKAVEYEADMVICGSGKCTFEEYIASANKSVPECGKEYFCEIDDSDSRRQFLKKDFNAAIWNKIYKKTMLLSNGINFPEGMIYDDIYFSGLVKQYAERVLVIKDVFYYHIIGESNASYGNKDKNMAFGYIEAQLELIAELKNRGKYQLYSDYYMDEFIVSYIGFVHSYCRQFGYIEIPLWNKLRECIFQLMPDLLESAVMKTGAQRESTEIIRESLKNPVDGKYILRLVQAMERELRKDSAKNSLSC